MIGKPDSKATEGAENMDEKQSPEIANGRQAAPPPLSRAALRQAHKEPKMPHDWLSRSLKKLYDDTACDPIPDSFVQLLDELDSKERENQERSKS